MNRLILDYLLVEGYSDAANKFSSESGLNLRDNKFDNISERTEVKNYIKSGDIIKSIELINEINPDVSFILLIYVIPLINVRLL